MIKIVEAKSTSHIKARLPVSPAIVAILSNLRDVLEQDKALISLLNWHLKEDHIEAEFKAVVEAEDTLVASYEDALTKAFRDEITKMVIQGKELLESCGSKTF